MRQLIVTQLDYDLTPVAGLALVGHYLAALQPVLRRLDAALPVKSGVANSDIVRSYVGLLVQGKSDFDAIENFRGDTFYKQALGIGLLPSSPTLGGLGQVLPLAHNPPPSASATAINRLMRDTDSCNSLAIAVIKWQDLTPRIRAMAPHWIDEGKLIAAGKQARQQLEELFAQERGDAAQRQVTAGWAREGDGAGEARR